MRTIQMIVAAVTAMVLTTSVGAAEAAPAPAAVAAEAPKCKPVKKDVEYMSWGKAVAVSAANAQPIVAFIELKGDKACSKMRLLTVGNKVFKDLAKDNFVYYHTGVPQKVSQRRGKKDKDEIAKPDFDAVKASEAKGVDLIKGNNKVPAFPMIAVVAPGGGKVIGNVMLAAEDVSFFAFVKELQSVFEQGKCAFVISKKVQKVLDEEAKKRAGK